MPIRTRAELKALFENGDQPDADAFIDLVDSFVHMDEALPPVDGSALTAITPAEWLAVAGAPTYVTATRFMQPGNLTSIYTETRRVRLTLSPGGNVYSAVRSSSYDALNDETTINLDDAVATANLSATAVSFCQPVGNGGAISWPMLGGMRQSEIIGLGTSNSATDPETHLDIAPGSCRDSSDTIDMRLAAGITKRLDLPWTVGDGQGGRLSDSLYSASRRTYAVWLIMRTDTGVIDVAFSVSFTNPALPANYDKKRLIGFIVGTSTPFIRQFVQFGDYFSYLEDTTYIEVSDSSLASAVYETGTLRAPPNCLAQVQVSVANTTSIGALDYQPVIRPVGSDASYCFGLTLDGAQYIDTFRFSTWVYLDANSQMEYGLVVVGGAPTLSINTLGCLMFSRSYLP